MSSDSLAEALEHEHHEIDEGVEAFLADATQSAALARALAALRRHIYLEETFLFSPLYEDGTAPSGGTIAAAYPGGMVPLVLVMLLEHAEIWRTIDAIEASVDAGTQAQTAQLCRELLRQLERHNAKEETIVYPEADRALTAQATAELMSFLEVGKTPPGWVCRAAGRPIAW